MILEDLIRFRKRFQNLEYSDRRLNGYIQSLDQSDIEFLISVEDCILEMQDDKNKFYTGSQLDTLINQKLTLQIDLGIFPNYFENFAEFIEKEKYFLTLDKYYIHEYGITESINQDAPLMQKYFQNLQLIEILKELADHNNISGGKLKVFFHRIGNSLMLPIDYSVDELNLLDLTDLTVVKQDIFNGIHKSERSKLFVNDLMNLFVNRERKYSVLIENWNLLKENYFSSFESYLEGFSFEKIKTSSLQYFQELNDKIHETIRKVANYIFGIPVAFLFLVSRLEFTDPSALKNFSLLGVGYLFIFLIHEIFIKNIKESLDSIKQDIERYENKIKHITSLGQIHSELVILKTVTLQEQYNKLRTLKLATFFIAIGLTILVLFLNRSILISFWDFSLTVIEQIKEAYCFYRPIFYIMVRFVY